LKKAEPLSLRSHQLKNLKKVLKPEKFGKNFRTYRDWNEEFQNCKMLPTYPTLQQLHRTKVLRRTNKEFLKAAAKLAKAIIRNEIYPLNPSDSKIENCYVFNNLFATYAKDGLNWEMPKDETSPTTYSAVNSDIKNLQILYNYDLNYINCINTCAVDYLGHRVIIQTVIQGILHFDQKTWNCYGSIDDGKTMNFNQNFHEKMKNVSNVFNLSLENVFRDQEGTAFNFHGSPEVKGIKAGDGRQYIMDLMRLSVRDANYPDKNHQECCVVRNEVIKNYLYFIKYEEEKNNLEKNKENTINSESNQQEIKEEEIKEEPKEELKKEEPKEELIKEEPNEEFIEDMIEPELKKEEDLEEEISKLKKFNPSLLTTLESVNANQEEQLEDLTKLGDFLKNNMITIFLNNMASNPLLVPMDMETLTSSMHKNGINLRYLGYIHSLIKTDGNNFLSKLIEKTIMVRSIRKYFRFIVFDESSELLLEIIIQNLNMLLGSDKVRNSIDEKILNENFGESNDKNSKNKNKKKKKNKKNKKKITVEKEETLNVFLKKTSAEFIKEILFIAKERYGFDVSEIKDYKDLSFLANKREKLCFLREFCKSMGFSINPKEYDFDQTENSFNCPIGVEDISGFKVLVKNADFFLEGLKYNYKTIDLEISRGQLERAYQITKGCQQLIINTYGIYNSDFIFTCSKLASIHFFKKEIDKAIKMQHFVVKLSERFYGIDHSNTAFSILELSNFYFEQKKTSYSCNLHLIALGIFDLIASSLNPNSLYCLHELQLLFEDLKDYNNSLSVLQELFDRNSLLFGQTDEKLLYIMNKLASLKAKIFQWKEASILQARHHLILSRLLKNEKNVINSNYKKSLELKLKESEKLRDFYSSKAKQN
jgi:protein TIF31